MGGAYYALWRTFKKKLIGGERVLLQKFSEVHFLANQL